LSETYRPAQAEELEPVAHLVAHSFPTPGRGYRWWMDFLGDMPFGGLESLWVAEEGGRLVGSCLLLSLRQWIAGVAVPVMGLGAVAISPSHRRRGLAQRMVTAGCRHARERGDLATALYPFRAAFYEGLGYGLAGEAHQYQVAPGLLPDDPAERMRVRLVDTPEEEAAMKAVYAQAARRLHTGQIERTDRSWGYLWGGDDVAAVVYRNDAGEPEGYCMVRYRVDLPPDRRYLEVEEQAWLTPAAQRGIYAWLGSLGDQWREIAYRAHPDEGFGDRIREPRLPLMQSPSWRLWFPSATLMRGPMFRLLDVAGALRARPLASAADATLRLEVDDPQVPENRGPWRVRIAGGAMEVEPWPGGRADADLATSIQTLSRIFIGAITPSQALAGALADAVGRDVAKLLDLAFEIPKPWMFDRF
jgi:predicted acetyltransferase